MTEQGPSHRQLIYDFFMTEAQRIQERTDWFMIFHAILLEAFFSHRSVTVGLLGVGTAFLWFVVGVRQWLELRQLGQCMGSSALMNRSFAQTYLAIFAAR